VNFTRFETPSPFMRRFGLEEFAEPTITPPFNVARAVWRM
jgi:hypothetical protein